MLEDENLIPKKTEFDLVVEIATTNKATDVPEEVEDKEE